MELRWLFNLWSDSISIEWWKMLLIGTFLFVLNVFVFGVSWCIHREIILECGYPKRRRKTMKKRVSSFSTFEQILLFRLVKEAERPSSLLIFTLICHFCCILGVLSCFVGLFACLITCADGWALTLLLFSEITVFFVTGTIEFIPYWAFVPSIRRKYRMK